MQSLEQLSEAKTIRDFFRLLSWETVSLFALLPALLFAVTPALQFFNNLSCGWWYNMTTDPINNTCSVLGGLVLLLCIGKMIAEPVSFRWLCKEYRPMFFSDICPADAGFHCCQRSHRFCSARVAAA